MLTIHATDFEQVDALWRMLAHVPETEFHPVAVVLNGSPWSTIIRTDNDRQLTERIPAQQP
jgi:hypothetical protein